MNTEQLKQRLTECFDAMDRKPLSIVQLAQLLRDCKSALEEQERQIVAYSSKQT